MVAIAILTSKKAREKSWKDLADIIKDVIPLEKLDSVYPTTQGMELCFVDKQSLVKFVSGAPPDLGVTSEDVATVVYVKPASGTGHRNIDDGAIVAVLKKYGEIKGAQHEFHPQSKIRNGVRKFQMDLRGEPPSSVSFGGVTFRVTYSGQVPKCFRCKATDHMVGNCPDRAAKVCHNCGSSSHLLKECPEPKRCVICEGTDHSYKQCRNSYAGKIKIASGKWEELAFEEMSDDEMMAAVTASTPGAPFSQPRSPTATQNVDVHQNVSGEESLTQLPLGTMKESEGEDRDGGVEEEAAGGVRNEEQGGVQGANGKETPILARTMRHRDGSMRTVTLIGGRIDSLSEKQTGATGNSPGMSMNNQNSGSRPGYQSTHKPTGNKKNRNKKNR